MSARDRKGRGEIAPTGRVVASGEELPGGLDWQAFSARYFPIRRRHELEALIAYGAYRDASASGSDGERRRAARRRPSLPSGVS
jgi:hypothetical protein